MESFSNRDQINAHLRLARELRAGAFHDSLGALARWIRGPFSGTEAR